MNQDVLIVSDRDSVLPYLGEAPGCKREGKSPQRRELVPLFRRVPQNPFEGAGFVIKAYEKIFPAGNDHGVVRAIVCRGIVMKPVTRKWSERVDKLSWIVSPGYHGCGDDVNHIPLLQHVA